MVESSEGNIIEIASKGSSIGELRKRADRERGKQKSTPVQVEVDMSPLVEPFSQISKGQVELTASLKNQKISLDNFFNLSQKQSKELVESFKKVPPREERERWVDAEYAQDFYTRFTPNLEPNFYTGLSSKERVSFDVRWQLARAAFYKQAVAGFPDKYRENQDLNLLGKEKMEILYKTKGVREMLQGYTSAIIEAQTYQGEAFWEISDATDFETFRIAVREEMLGNVSFEEEVEALPDNVLARMKSMKKGDRKKEKEEWVKLFKKEADAIAWNWLWVSNLAESADSRYSESGAKYSRFLPAAVTADEFKYVLHPQERFEGKCLSQHHWKAFGRWGATQVKIHKDRLFKKFGNENKYEIRFAPAKKGQYWNLKEVPGEKPRDKRKDDKAVVYQIDIPECYPVTTTTSFLEYTNYKDKNTKTGKDETVTLLEAFKEGREVLWSEVSQDAWAIYLFGQFHKAYQLLEYWDGVQSREGKPIELGKPFAVKVWADPLQELFVRLKPEKTLKGLKGKTDQTFSNLKVWAAMVGTGGVNDINSKNPKFNLDIESKLALAFSLKHKKIKFLEKGEGLTIK
jgi:hypothetical protein